MNINMNTLKLGLLTTIVCYVLNIVLTMLLLVLLLIPVLGYVLSIVAGIAIIVASYVISKYILTKSTYVNWKNAVIMATAVYVVTNLLTSILPFDTLLWLIAPVVYAFLMDK